MDVILIAGSLALSPYLSKFLMENNGGSGSNKTSSLLASSSSELRHPKRQPSWAVTVSASVSFLLLTVSVLEAIPSSLVLFLKGTGILSRAYRVVFTILVLLIFMIFPFCAGAQQQRVVLQMLSKLNLSSSSSSSSSEKQAFFHGRRRLPYCLFQFLICLIRCSFRIVYCVTFLPAKRLLRPRQEKGPILAMSTDLNEENEKTPFLTSEEAGTVVSSWRIPRLSTFIGGFLGILAIFCGLGILGPWVVRTTDATPLLTVSVSWLTAAGLLISACINGFGSVSLPHSCLAGLYLQPIRPESIAKAEKEIVKAETSLQDRKDQLNGVKGLLLAPATGAMSTEGSLAKNCKISSFSDLGEDIALRRKKLQTEIDFLETLVAEMKDEATEMKEAQIMAISARTPMGRFKSWLGVVFSIVLLVRLFSAFTFVWKHDHGGMHSGGAEKSSGKSDAITTILLWLVGHDYARQQDYNALSQLISVILTAILSFSQVRTFWRIVHAVDRKLQLACCTSISNSSNSNIPKTPPDISTSLGSKQQMSKDAGSSSSLYTYLLACLMGCYFLSCLVLTKLMLPKDSRAAFANALGDDSHLGDGKRMFRIRSYAVNLTFALSATVTVFVLGIVLGIQRQNTVRHLSIWTSASTSKTNSSSSNGNNDDLDP